MKKWKRTPEKNISALWAVNFLGIAFSLILVAHALGLIDGAFDGIRKKERLTLVKTLWFYYFKSRSPVTSEGARHLYSSVDPG